MSRDISGVAFPPPGVYASPLTTIQSQAQQNALIDDIYQILNSPWPEQYGGTGQTSGSPTLEEVQALINAVASVPVGSLHVTTGAVLPGGYIWANGGSYSRTTYSDLWEWVQDSGNLASSQAGKTVGQYGPGNGSSTFTVPNLTEYFVRGSGGERTAGSMQEDSFRSHTHNGTTSNNTHNHGLQRRSGSGSVEGASFNNSFSSSYGATDIMRTVSDTHNHTFTTGETGGSETRPKNIAYPYMIKV